MEDNKDPMPAWAHLFHKSTDLFVQGSPLPPPIASPFSSCMRQIFVLDSTSDVNPAETMGHEEDVMEQGVSSSRWYFGMSLPFSTI